MESEKVKEIKKALKYAIDMGLVMGKNTMFVNIKLADILTLINELESELEKEQINNLNCDTELQYKEKRIAELEKENAKLLDSVETVQNNRCVYKCVLTKENLKQFATLLKVKTVLTPSGWCVNIEDIDETLKEFIGE